MLNDLFSEYRFLQYTPHDRHKILYLYLFFGSQWKQEIFLLLEEMGEEFFLSGYPAPQPDREERKVRGSFPACG